MTFAKKILISTESREIFVLRTGKNVIARQFCASCMRDCEMLTIDQAVSVSGIGTKEIIRLANGSLHAIETDTKHLMICFASIAGGNLN